MPGSRLKLAPGKPQVLGSVGVLPGAPTQGVLGDVKVSEGSWDSQSGVGRKVLLLKVDAEDLLSLNSKVTGTVRNITGAPGTTLAPLLGDVTGDAGTTGVLESY